MASLTKLIRYALHHQQKAEVDISLNPSLKRLIYSAHKTALAAATSSLIFILGPLLNVNAEVPQEIREQKLAQTVKLMGANPNQCGSGAIIAPGRLITVTHVINGICPVGELTCPALKLFDSDEQELATVVPLLGNAIRSIDIAELNGPSIVGMAQDESTLGAPRVESAVIIAGFPNCKGAEVRAGKITKVTPLYFEVDTEGAFGLSGGAIYGARGELLGLVDQAATLSGALSGRLLGGAFNLRAIRADRVFGVDVINTEPINYSPLQTKPLIDSITEASLLLEHYRESVRPIQGFSRLSASGEFLAMVAQFRKRFAEQATTGDFNSELAQISLNLFSQVNTGLTKSTLTYISQQLNPTFLQQISPATNAPALLAIAEAAERFGGFRETLGTNEISEDIKEVALAQNSYPGYEVMEASVLLTLGLVAMLWALSIGYAYGRSKGSRLRRMFVTIAVAVLGWPISLIAFLIFGRRSELNKKSAPEAANT